MSIRSALYYPHTKIQSEALFKTALLLWDKLHIIAPSPRYIPNYSSRAQNEAFELIGRCHYPSDKEKQQTHELVEDFATRPLPDAFSYRAANGSTAIYEVYSDKLLPETWQVLHEAGLAGRRSGLRGYPTAESTGLSLMSLLADCCAGKSLARVTDRALAYASLAGLLTGVQDASVATEKARQALLPIAVTIADVQDLALEGWIAFRKREEGASDGHLVRQLRHRFVACIEAQAQTLAAAENSRDREELRRQFEQDMRDDYRALREALKLEAHQTLGTKELITAVVGGIATIGAVATHQLLPMPGVITATGAIVAVGGLIAGRGRFLSSRRKLLVEHPMAYLYEAGDGLRL
jgi:hypothetical protein